MSELIPKVLFLHDGPMRELNIRLRRNFSQVWKRLPPRAQKTISEYFRQHRGTVYLCYRMDHDEQNPFGRASYGNGQTALTFSAPYFALTTTDEMRTSVIAHELAHIYRRGSGEWTKDNEAEELATRALSLRWGFESPSLRDAEHQADLEQLAEEWRQNNSNVRNELESRWLGRADVTPRS